MVQAKVKDIVTQAISGHATEEMQRHYSTVNDTEMQESIGKVISLSKAKELLETSRAKKRTGGTEGGTESRNHKKKSASRALLRVAQLTDFYMGAVGFEPAASTV